MRISHIFAALVLFPLCAAAGVDKGTATTAGTWALDSTDEPGKVQLTLQGSGHGDHFNTSSPWLLADLRGLDWAGAPKHDVHFTIQRDAGSIDCEGFVQAQRGSGLFTFTANPHYVAEMTKLGFSFEDRQLLSATIFDVSFDFARAMKSAAVRGLDAGKLFAFRIHGVTPEFVKDLRSAGIETTDPEKLIAFRIHGVSPEFAGEISHLGYPNAPPEQLIAMRIHGVTPQYIEGLRSKGLQNLTLDQLIRLRIHGID
jgi:hypothetical protein